MLYLNIVTLIINMTLIINYLLTNIQGTYKNTSSLNLVRTIKFYQVYTGSPGPGKIPERYIYYIISNIIAEDPG